MPAAAQDVIAIASIQRIIIVVSPQAVVTIATVKRIAATSAMKLVVPGKTTNNIAELIASEVVSVPAADDVNALKDGVAFGVATADGSAS